MTIRIFNPEHDIALASGQERFTSPHAGRQLRSDLGFLPAIWAEEGDVVLVDDIDAAQASWQRLRFVSKRDLEFCTFLQIPDILKSNPPGEKPLFDPWGWDAAIRFQFMDAGVPEVFLPSKDDICVIRQLSSRIHTTEILKTLRSDIAHETCGESHYCDGEERVHALASEHGDIVVKAPWSSSGRGVRYLPQNTEGRLAENTWNWIRNTIRLQGGVMVEPLYNKVKDFGVEFEATAEGRVEYRGLSLFETHNGAYTGNLLCDEDTKMEIMAQYIPADLLQKVVAGLEQQLSAIIGGRYVGALGVDMMIVGATDGYLLHPCVEVNLRRTMGHVALALTDALTIPRGTMQVAYEQRKYHLKIK